MVFNINGVPEATHAALKHFPEIRGLLLVSMRLEMQYSMIQECKGTLVSLVAVVLLFGIGCVNFEYLSVIVDAEYIAYFLLRKRSKYGQCDELEDSLRWKDLGQPLMSLAASISAAVHTLPHIGIDPAAL